MKLQNIFIITIFITLLSGCSSYKKVPYIQDAELVNNIQEALPMYDAKIMPKDLLTITVNTTDPEVAAPFNLTVQSSVNVAHSRSLTQQPILQQYLVSNDGTIDFPVLGTLQVGGLTKGEAESLIREKLGEYLKETPIVTVRMSNYKISVLGEVSRPGVFTISNEKVNIFEALAMAGDLTIWGMRDNVKLIREDADGQRNIIYLNLNRADIVTSPYYYLQQNDILYVTPNKTKAKNSDIGQSTNLWISGTSILVSLINILVTFLVLK
jgi:polysaccharide export outer membrane protein